MGEIEIVQINDEKMKALRKTLSKKPDVFPIVEDLDFTSLLVSCGISHEVGTANDELARFIFDAQTNQLVPRESLKAEVIRWKGKIGVRISSSASSTIEIRIKGFHDLCHPDLGENADGSFRHVSIFPEMAAKIAALHGIGLVVVKTWALNSIFGGFDRNKGYYETNFWELENNDTLLFANLLSQKRLAFLGTHDLIAHVAGLDGRTWPALLKNAGRVEEAIRNFTGTSQASIPDLVLPYTAGVILDDLAQPPSYLSKSHQIMLDEVLAVMNAPRKPTRNALLLKYPALFENVITLSRSPSLVPGEAKDIVAKFVDQIRAHTAQFV